MNYIIAFVSLVGCAWFAFEASTERALGRMAFQSIAGIFMFLVCALFAQGFDFNDWMTR